MRFSLLFLCSYIIYADEVVTVSEVVDDIAAQADDAQGPEESEVVESPSTPHSSFRKMTSTAATLSAEESKEAMLIALAEQLLTGLEKQQAREAPRAAEGEFFDKINPFHKPPPPPQPIIVTPYSIQAPMPPAPIHHDHHDHHNPLGPLTALLPWNWNVWNDYEPHHHAYDTQYYAPQPTWTPGGPLYPATGAVGPYSASQYAPVGPAPPYAPIPAWPWNPQYPPPPISWMAQRFPFVARFFSQPQVLLPPPRIATGPDAFYGPGGHMVESSLEGFQLSRLPSTGRPTSREGQDGGEVTGGATGGNASNGSSPGGLFSGVLSGSATGLSA